MIPRGEMRDGHPPQLLADRVAARELLAFGVAYAQPARVVRRAVAGEVQVGQAVGHADDLDD